MNVELTRFRVKPGKAKRVKDWMATLNRRMSDVLVTLEREQMLVEVIFQETIDGQDYLSWFSIQGDEGEPLETSPHELDRVHQAFWQECIDPDFKPQDAELQVIMMPASIQKFMRAYLTHFE